MNRPQYVAFRIYCIEYVIERKKFVFLAIFKVWLRKEGFCFDGREDSSSRGQLVMLPSPFYFVPCLKCHTAHFFLLKSIKSLQEGVCNSLTLLLRASLDCCVLLCLPMPFLPC